jgi:hypothetical protein
MGKTLCGTIDNLGTHLLRCPYESECKAAHDMFRDTIIAVALGNGTHVQREVSHLCQGLLSSSDCDKKIQKMMS